MAMGFVIKESATATPVIEELLVKSKFVLIVVATTVTVIQSTKCVDVWLDLLALTVLLTFITVFANTCVATMECV
jgi:hypothetical protein